MHTRPLLALLAFAAGLAAGAAQAQQTVDDFVNGNGHARIDFAEPMERYRDALSTDVASVSWPDEGMGPIEKAMLFVDAVEGELPRARWLYRMGRTGAPSSTGDDEIFYFVDVTRFNLGPAMHAETVAAHGAEATDDVASFGTGPTVSWRLVMTPVMGMTADIVEAGRREWSDAQTEGATCFAQPCLSTAGIVDGLGDWRESAAAPQAPALPYEAKAAARLANLAGLAHGFDSPAGRATQWNEPEKPERLGDRPDPYLGGLVEVGLGSDPVAEIAMVYAGVNDTSIREVWHRAIDFDGSLTFMTFTTPR